MASMNIEDIITKRDELNHQLKQALSTMEYSDKIEKIRQEIAENQARCPHIDAQYNWTMTNQFCPYCGKYICF